MKTSSHHEIINLISMISILFGFILLLFFWNDLNIFKIIAIFLFMCLFVYMLKNSHEKRKKYETKHLTIDSAYKKRTGPAGETLNRVENFFNSLSERNEPNYFEQNKNPWERSLMFASQGITRSEPYQNYEGEDFYEIDKRKSEQIRNQKEIRLFIPQSLASMFEQIKGKISPHTHLMKFFEEIHNLKGGKIEYSNGNLSKYRRTPSSLVLDKDKNLLLEKDYNIIIKNEEFCAEVISEYLEEKLESILSRTQNTFHRISEMVMKIFGVKVNFYGSKRSVDFDSGDITILELREFLIRWRKDSCIPQKFKLTISIREFTQNYFNQLSQLTEIACQFLLYSERNDELAFRLYVQVLNEEFQDERIIITENLSSLSEESKKIKHAFLIHHAGNEISFSYNRIQKLITSNPLVIMMAYFAEDYRINFNRKNEISKQLKKFFKEKITTEEFSNSLGIKK